MAHLFLCVLLGVAKIKVSNERIERWQILNLIQVSSVQGNLCLALILLRCRDSHLLFVGW